MKQIDVNVGGSCLCGSVQYRIRGQLVRFYHCHCGRCRKATGTGHATNMLVSPMQSIEWISGESLLSDYKVPEAERFYNRFCTRCGSPMPRTIAQLDGVMIPAGSLDEEPPVKPQGRIFWDSRSEWSCSDELPTFAEYPPNI